MDSLKMCSGEVIGEVPSKGKI